MDRFEGDAAALAALRDEARGDGAQHRRLLRLRFPGNDGPDGAILLANRLDASESLSRDFSCVLELLSDNAAIPLAALMGRLATVELVRQDGSLRFFNGHVLEFSLTRTDGGLAFYRMVLGPWLAFLRLRKNSAAFQHLNIAELTERVLGDYPMRDCRRAVGGPDPAITYLCQHEESDHNFLHRRWEALGWHYAYAHRADGHTLVLGDDTTGAPAIDGADSAIPFQDQAGSTEDDGIRQWRPLRAARPAGAALASYDFKQARAALAEGVSLLDQGAVPSLEVYDSTGLYGFKDSGDGEALARRRMEESDARAASFAGEGNDRRIEPGRWFTLSGHFDAAGAQRPYLVLGVHHHASNNYQDGDHDGATSHYHNSFTCIERDVPWRPGPGFYSVEALVHGVQTAIVTGPPGEEIYTDGYGRIKLRFHWDRHGAFDDSSSPWVRVMSGWAGSRCGRIAPPRIGMEVVVQFADGCVDRPLVIGCLYNARNMPPWPLPENRTQSGLLTRSSKGAQPGQANALRFEDLAGQEELWLHAEKNQRIEVEHDEAHRVGNDRRKTVARDEVVQVGNDRGETVGRDESITVHGRRDERVDGNEGIAIGGDRGETVHGDESVRVRGNRRERVDLTGTESVGLASVLAVGGLYSVAVGAEMHTAVAGVQLAHIAGNKASQVGTAYRISVADSFVVKVGAARFSMYSDGSIVIDGTHADIDASGKVRVDGKNSDVN